MKQKLTYFVLLIISIVLILFPFTLQLSLDIRMSNKESNILIDDYDNKLYTTYYPSITDKYSISKFGVMIFHGMAEDQRSFNLFVSKFQRLGMEVFCLDFSGHCRSTGVMPDGANGDIILGHQVNVAKAKFKELSGLNDSQIFMVGHSLGARAILTSQIYDSSPINGCILLGPAVYLDYNFGGHLEEGLGPSNPDTNIFILTGDLEDVCPPDKALKLFQKLTNDTILATAENIIYKTTLGLRRDLIILKWLTHTNEAFSVRTVQYSTLWIESIITGESQIQPNADYLSFEDFRVYFSYLEIIGIILSLIYATKLIKVDPNENNLIIDTRIETFNIIDPRKYFAIKIAILSGALSFGTVAGFLLVLLPMGTPIFNLLYFCPVFGYGCIMSILYKTNRVPGYKGNWKFRIKESFKSINWLTILFGLLVLTGLTALLSYYFRGFMYTFFPGNVKVIWLFILIILTTFGF
ncbi:MAG: alpha/beta hydrolase [Asgard group archaeon]|nr:alpha/beta hydrolase [Asgard group archaeon]